MFCFVPFKPRPRQNDLVLNETEDGLGHSAAESLQLFHDNNVYMQYTYTAYNMHCVAGVWLKGKKILSFLIKIEFFFNHKPIAWCVLQIYRNTYDVIQPPSKENDNRPFILWGKNLVEVCSVIKLLTFLTLAIYCSSIVLASKSSSCSFILQRVPYATLREFAEIIIYTYCSLLENNLVENTKCWLSRRYIYTP